MSAEAPSPPPLASTGLPKRIKAVVQPDAQSTALIELTITSPEPTGTDYLVQVKATSPCLRERSWPALYSDLFPPGSLRIPGTEGAGVIVGPTPPGGDFKIGDEVFYRTDAWIPGSMCEYTIVPAKYLALKPASLSWTEAAATPLSALTAWQGLFEHGSLDPRAITGDPTAREKNAAQRVLITGAAGGVGSWAVRFAHAAGAGAVVAVCSASKVDIAREYGASDIIDYTSTNVVQWIAADTARKVDLVFDCAGANLDRYWAAVKPRGRYLSVVGDPAASRPTYADPATVGKWFLVEPRGTDLKVIADLINTSGWKPLIDSVVPFEQFAAAYDKVDSGKTTGKVVITVP